MDGAKEELFLGSSLSFSSSSSSPIIGRRGALYSTGVDRAALSRAASSIPPEVKRDFVVVSFFGFSSSVLSSSSLRESIKAELSTILSFLSSSIFGTSSSSYELCLIIVFSSGIGSKSGKTRGVLGFPIPEEYSGAGPISSSSRRLFSSSIAFLFFSSSMAFFFLIFSAFASIFSFSI